MIQLGVTCKSVSSLVMDGHRPQSVGSVNCYSDERSTFLFQLKLNYPLPALISAASNSTDASLILYHSAVLFQYLKDAEFYRHLIN